MHFAVHKISFLVLLAAMTTADKWFQCTVLDTANKYNVCWRTIPTKSSNNTKSSDEIEFRVEVEAHGYVGFGLSKKGRMAGSDIVTGWIKDGNVHFQDRFATGNDMPEMDRIQSWNLIEGNENDTHTSLVFRRKLDTCDDQDIVIDENDVQLIYAYSDKDPSDENKLKYHRKNRGQKYVNLLRSDAHQKVDKSTLSYWDVLLPNVSITSDFTSNTWCKVYRSPTLSKKNHIVMAEPNIHKDHERYVHHMILMECIGTEESEFEPLVDHRGQKCEGMINLPGAMKKCIKWVLLWGIGNPEIVFPKNVGVALDPGPSKYFLLQVHINNPFRDTGKTVSSGFRVYYTPHLREKEAGVLIIGSAVAPTVVIPPGAEKYTVAAHSSAECFDSDIPEDGLKIIGVQLHAHGLARHLKVRHFRNDTELVPLADNAFFDSRYEDATYLSNEVTFHKGDQITLECTYNSTERENATLGGENAANEMCFSIFLYYPKITLYSSWTTPSIEKVSQQLKANITYSSNIYEEIAQLTPYISNLNWTTFNISQIEEELRFADQTAICFDTYADLRLAETTVNYPKKFKPYKRPMNCTRN